MSAAQSALEARSLDVIQCEDKSGQFICYRSGQIYLLTTPEQDTRTGPS